MQVPSKKDSAFVRQAKGNPQPKAKGTSKGKPPPSLSKESSKKGNQSSSHGNKKECSFCRRSGHLEERYYAKEVASTTTKEEGKSKSTASHTNPRDNKILKLKWPVWLNLLLLHPLLVLLLSVNIPPRISLFIPVESELQMVVL